MSTLVIRNRILQMGFLLLLGGLMIQLSSSCSNTSEKQAEALKQAEARTIAARAVTGEEIYISYCQICHGSKGKLGAMADILTVEPLDLRYISARRNGNFPEDDLYMIIDGRTGVKGHGDRNMPIWGSVFKESEALQSEEAVNKRIKMVVNYLKSIQEEMPEQ